MPSLKPSTARALVPLVLMLTTVALYWPVRHHEFVWLDDPDYVTENAFVKMGLSWESVTWAFTHTFSSNWHPLTWLSHMLDWQWFGPNAGGHHLTSVFFHAINSALLLGFLHTATGAFWRSALVAALFAWHPTHVESVAWVSERKDVLSTCFGLLSLWTYVKYARSEKTSTSDPFADTSHFTFHASRWYWLTLLFLACGLMSKPMLVTWPCVMLLLDFWPLRRIAHSTRHAPEIIPNTRRLLELAPCLRRLLLEKLPFLALVIASCVITILTQDKWRSLAKADQLPLEYRLLNAVVSYAAYLGKMLWPADLAAFYPFPAEPPWEPALLCSLLLGIVTFLIVRQFQRRPFLLTGWFWYLGTLVPVIGIVQVGGQAMADRYTYVPSIGFFVALVWWGAELAGTTKARRWGLSILAIVAIVACLPLSARQVATWKNSRTLFEQARRVTTGNFIALNTLGELLRREGRLDEAITYFREAVAAGPLYAPAWCGLGMALYQNGQKEEGIACHRQALKLNPDDPQALDNLGLLLFWENRPEEAEPLLRHAVTVRPGFAEAHAHLASVLAALGRNEEALEHLNTAVRFKPEAHAIRLGRAAMLMKQGRVDEAHAEFRTVVAQQPGNLDARLAMAGLLMESGRIAEATEEFRHVVTQSPTNIPALDGLGYALAQNGQVDEAQRCFEAAVALSPTNGFARLHLGMMLQRKGEVAAAMTEYRRAIESNPQLTAALNNLAWLQATHPDAALRNGAEAVSLAKRACELTQEREPIFIGTLAAAYAEAGQFAEAVAAAERARDLAQEAGLTEVARRNEELLDLYRSGKPYREP